MRVIAGSLRGRKLFSPDGSARPTTDRVKESLFNIIQFDVPGAAVLDLFAGSGQLGIEALSRGAASAVFVDSSKQSLETVKKNTELCGLCGRSRLILSDAFSFLASCREKFDIVFLDPPYREKLCPEALELLGSVLRRNCAVICETQADEVLPSCAGSLELRKEYRYSDIKLTVYRGL